MFFGLKWQSEFVSGEFTIRRESRESFLGMSIVPVPQIQLMLNASLLMELAQSREAVVPNFAKHMI